MEVQVSHELSDPVWDDFLDQMPRSHYTQSSLWAQIKAKTLGWHCVRMTIGQGGEIIAGFQALLRPLPFGGTVGYIPRGPVITSDDRELIDLVLEQLHQVVRTEHLLFLKVQPAHGAEALEKRLLDAGFLPSHARTDDVATMLIDLSRDEDTLLRNMKKRVRKGVNRAVRRGAVVRQGTADDLHFFYNIFKQTSERGRFPIHSETYYREIWEHFAPAGHAALFFAECEGEVVSTVFVITFGNTAFARYGGWNGRYGEYQPNYLMRWRAIQWAKEQGYRWYDFMGIDEDVARAILQDQPVPDLADDGGYTFFKLGFGGQVTLSPSPYDYVSHPLLAKGFEWLQNNRKVYDRLMNIVRGVVR